MLGEVADRTGHRLRLPLTHAEEVARALRGSLLRFAIDPPPAVLSGHERDGERLERPHVAFLALPGPGSRESPATIAGVARPAIVVGTIDMIGSKLLFSGYGDGRYGRAHHAGLTGYVALIVHDGSIEAA